LRKLAIILLIGLTSVATAQEKVGCAAQLDAKIKEMGAYTNSVANKVTYGELLERANHCVAQGTCGRLDVFVAINEMMVDEQVIGIQRKKIAALKTFFLDVRPYQNDACALVQRFPKLFGELKTLNDQQLQRFAYLGQQQFPSQSMEEKINSPRAKLAELTKSESIAPQKTLITGQTRDIAQAMYLKMVEKKIEKVGTTNFPTMAGKSLYGNLIVNIPIFQDGSIFEKDGGPKVERSSGDAQLDESALNIVRQAAPFGAIPNGRRSKDREDVWVVITTFNFKSEKVSLGAEVENSH
jgi:TonB family protein